VQIGCMKETPSQRGTKAWVIYRCREETTFHAACSTVKSSEPPTSSRAELSPLPLCRRSPNPKQEVLTRRLGSSCMGVVSVIPHINKKFF
jgi:hypothetical protein